MKDYYYDKLASVSGSAREKYLAEQCLSFDNQIQDLLSCTFIQHFHRALKKVTRRWMTHHRRPYGRIQSIQDIVKLTAWENSIHSYKGASVAATNNHGRNSTTFNELQQFCNFCTKMEQLRQRFTSSIYQPLLDFFYNKDVGGRKLVKIANALQKIAYGWDQLLNTDQIQPKYFSSASATWLGVPNREQTPEFYDVLRLLPDVIEKAFEALRLSRQWRLLVRAKTTTNHNENMRQRNDRQTTSMESLQNHSDSGKESLTDSPRSDDSPLGDEQNSDDSEDLRNSSNDKGKAHAQANGSMNECDMHRRQLKKVEKELKVTKRKCNHLEKQLRAAVEACETLQADRDRAEKECQKLREELRDNKRLETETATRVERAENRNHFLEDEINRAMQRMHSSEEQLMRATDHVKWLRKELERTRQRSSHLEIELEHLYERMQGLKLELDNARQKQHSLHGNLQLLQRLEDFHELTGVMEPSQLATLRSTLSNKLEVVEDRSRSIESDLDNCLNRCHTLQGHLDIARARERVMERYRNQANDKGIGKESLSSSSSNNSEQVSAQKPGLTDRLLTEFQLNEIARVIRDYWKDLARALGINDAEICAIECDNRGSTHEQKYTMLLKWRDRCGEQATVRNLVAAMLRINQQFDANIIVMTCSAS